MSGADIGYLLSLALVVFILTQIKEHPFRLLDLVRPLVIVAVVGVVFLRAIPAEGNDLRLITITVLTGAILGMLSGLTTRLRVKEDIVLSSVGVAAIIFWCLGVVARSAFSLYAQYGGGPVIAHFSLQHRISENGWVAALVLMALVEVVARTITLAVKAKHTTGRSLTQIFAKDNAASQTHVAA